jgi:predicted O-methyltransferase YrrM
MALGDVGTLEFIPVPVRRVVNRTRKSANRMRFVRKRRLLRHYGGSLADPVGRRYVLLDPELDNFTYDLDNEQELASVIATALAWPEGRIADYFAEAHDDAVLHRLPRRPMSQKTTPQYARRLGWYAIARALKPEVVVETGVHSGLGSVLLLRALDRNRSGLLLSFDVDPQAGWLVPEGLRSRWRMIVGKTTDTLEGAIAGRTVGMVVHDSDHSYDCEYFELTTALRHAAPEIAVVSDNSHVTTALPDVLREFGVEPHFFRERPRGHFYPGATLGVGVLRRP